MPTTNRSASAFEFLVPIEKGIVRDPRTGDLFVDGPLSTPNKDLQGERVLTRAVAEGLDTFLRLGGPVDYDHRSVARQTPHEFDRDGAPVRFIIGQNAGIRKGTHAGHDVFFMRTKLMKGKRATADLMEHVNEGGKLFYSIGGVVTRRIETAGGPVVHGTKITHVALTPYPANPDCGVTPVGISGLQKSLKKALTAGGQVSGLGSTGGRALVPEDLEGAQPKRRKKRKCGSDCTCPACSSDSAVRNNTDVRGITMGKNLVLDPETRDALKGLEGDQHLGPIAKALAAVAGFVGLKKSKDDSDEDDDADPDGDPSEGPDDDDDSDDEGQAQASGAPPYGKMAAKFGKSAEFQYYEPEPEARADVDADAFAKSLLGAVGQMLAVNEKRVAHIVRLERKALEKSLGTQVAQTMELQKGLRGDLVALGMKPAAPNPYRVQNGGGPGAQPNGQRPDKKATLAILENMALHKGLNPTLVTQFEIGEELSPDLAQMVQQEFAKSMSGR